MKKSPVFFSFFALQMKKLYYIVADLSFPFDLEIRQVRNKKEKV